MIDDTDKMLNWHLGDIERKFGFQGSKYTDVGLGFALLITLIVSGVFFGALFLMPAAWRQTRAASLVLERGWTPYAMVGLFILALSILWAKAVKLGFQKKAFGIKLIPEGAAFSLTPETALEVMRKLNASVDEPERFVLFNRIKRALQNLHNVGNLSDVSEMLRSQAENDESHFESSYGLLYGIVWAIPILGFIGTVIGLSGAIGSFGLVLNGDGSNIGALKEGLGVVTGNLGIAFDTTFLALILAMVVQLLMTVIKKREELFLDECRDYAHVNVISRLRIAASRGNSQPGEIIDNR